MAERNKERDVSLLENDLKKIISVLRKNFPKWKLENCCRYSFYKKDKKNNRKASFCLEGESFVDEKYFERAISVLQQEFPNFRYERDIMYKVGNMNIYVHNFEGKHEIYLRKHTDEELDKKISKVLSKSIQGLENSYSYDDYNDVTKGHIFYTNPDNIDLKIR